MNKKNSDKKSLGEPLLRVTDLWREFNGPHGRIKVLRGVHFEADAGEMVFILGRSGSGKSTLLQCLGGLDLPTKGSVQFRNHEVTHFDGARLCEFRRKQVGFVFQFYHLIPELTLYENILLPSMIDRSPKPKLAKRLLDRVGLGSRRDHFPSQLSGGEQQRAAIARALANDPEMILCDEPTGNLDEETAREVFDLLLELNREEKKTFVIVTHESGLIRKQHTVYRLHDGVLEAADD